MAKIFEIHKKEDSSLVAGPGESPLSITGLAPETVVEAGTYYAIDVTEGKQPSDPTDIPAFTVPKTPPANIPVTGVTLSPESTAIDVGKTTQLTAVVAPQNATNKAVTYASSDTSVATVSPAGVVTGVKEGIVTITVTTTDGGKKATAEVGVSNPVVAVTSVELAPQTASIAIGATQQLTATVKPDNATNKTLHFTSDKPEFATVDDSGLVTAVAAGVAQITVNIEDSDKQDVATITVTPS